MDAPTYQIRRDGPYTHLSVFSDGKYVDGATVSAVNWHELLEWLTARYPNAKGHKLSLDECHDQGYKDGRFSFHDGALWSSLSRPKRAAYDRGNVAGRKSPVRC